MNSSTKSTSTVSSPSSLVCTLDTSVESLHRLSDSKNKLSTIASILTSQPSLSFVSCVVWPKGWLSLLSMVQSSVTFPDDGSRSKSSVSGEGGEGVCHNCYGLWHRGGAVLCRSTLDKICGTACSIRSTPQYRSMLRRVIYTVLLTLGVVSIDSKCRAGFRSAFRSRGKK